MPDMLVKLYEIEDDWSFLEEQRKRGVLIRKPIGPEKQLLVDWVKETFGEGWSAEMDMAFANRPLSCFIAIEGKAPIGFACYDATALGYLGPMGVEENRRLHGVGRALLLACLLDMKLKGYGYAIIGWVGPAEFYSKTVGAVVIEDSDSAPSVYKTMLLRSPT